MMAIIIFFRTNITFLFLIYPISIILFHFIYFRLFLLYSKKMDLYFFRPAEYAKYYNCSLYLVEDVPFSERRNLIYSMLALVHFVVLEIPYFICMLAMWRHLDNSAYKIMFIIGLVDIPQLCVIALLSGILGMMGAAFCSYPDLIYFAGMFALFFWSIETTLVCILAVNRCLQQAYPNICHTLFKGRRTWLCMLPVLIYSIKYGFFTRPTLWSSIGFMWDGDPYIGYNVSYDAEYYPLIWDKYHSFAVALLIPFIYLLFFAIFWISMGQCGGILVPPLLLNPMFFQIFAVALANCTNGLVAAFISYIIAINEDLASFLNLFPWIFAHGFPPLVYLAYNRTIRKECQNIWCELKLKLSRILFKARIIPHSTAVVSEAVQRIDSRWQT